jgi:subtilisin-like proprotein convertase family protein
MRSLLTACAFALALGPAFAPSVRAELLYGESGLAVAIPDNSAQGILRTLTLSGLDNSVNYSVRLSLRIGGTGFGGYVGDLYAYLAHASPDGEYRMAVLLNRPGRTEDEPSGYDDSGLDVIFSDTALYDIHLYRNNSPTILSGILYGEWQPDGRLTSPFEVDESSPRVTSLDSMGEIDPNGEWHLYLADLEAGGTMQLESWGLSLTPLPANAAVPEPASILSAILLLALATVVARQRSRQRLTPAGSPRPPGNTTSR